MAASRRRSAGLGLVAGGDTHGLRMASIPHPGHFVLYIYSVTPGGRRRGPRPRGRPGRRYIAGWRPSSVSPQAAAFTRDVVAAAAPEGRERAKNLLWTAAEARGLRASAGPGPGARDRCSTVGDRAVRALRTGPVRRGAPDPAHEPAVHRRRVVPQLYPADVALPRERAKPPYSAAEIAGFLALAEDQPAAGDGCGRRAGLPGRRRRTDPRRPARWARYRRPSAGRAASSSPCRATGPGGAGPFPLLRPAAGRGALRRDRRRSPAGPTRPPEHHAPADPVTLDGGTGLPRLDTPAACHLAAGRPRNCSAWPPSCTPPGSPAPQRLGDLVAALAPAESPPRSGCSGRPRRHEHPAGRCWKRSPTPPASPRGSRRCCPPGCAPGSCGSGPLLAGMLLVPGRPRPAYLTGCRDA